LTVAISCVAHETLLCNVIVQEVPRSPVVVIDFIRHKVTSLWHCQVAEIGGLSEVAADCSSWVIEPVDLARLLPEFSGSLEFHASKPELLSLGAILRVKLTSIDEERTLHLNELLDIPLVVK